MTDEEVVALIQRELDASEVAKINHWLSRGDGVAVYENHHIGHPGLGDKQFVSFGSADAQLEVDEPPQVLPDISNKINWRFWLIATYRGEPIASPEGNPT